MKVAIACEGVNVSSHFGHCEGFMVYKLEQKQIQTREFVPNPGHKPGFLPKYLKDMNVNKIIAGGMGERAQELFKENQIEVIVGATGLCDENIKSYIDGKLVSNSSVCTSHVHAGDCGGH